VRGARSANPGQWAIRPSVLLPTLAALLVSIKLARKAMKLVRARGKLRVRARAAFTPAGGTRITNTKRVILRKR
jgi:hypothetical protein